MELSIPLYLRQQDAWQYQKSVEGRPSASRGLLQAHNSSHGQRLRKLLNRVSNRRRRFSKTSYKKSVLISIVEKREIRNPYLRGLMAVVISTGSSRPSQYLNGYSYIPIQSRPDERRIYPSINLIPSTRTRSCQHVSTDASLGFKFSEYERHAVDGHSSTFRQENVEEPWNSLNEVKNIFASSGEYPPPKTVRNIRPSDTISSVSNFSEASSGKNVEVDLGFLSTSITETSISINDPAWLGFVADVKTFTPIRAPPNIKEEDIGGPGPGYSLSQLVEKLVKDFRVHMEQNLTSRGSEHETCSSASSRVPTNTTSENSSVRGQGSKRVRVASSHENEDMSGDDDGDRPSFKRSRAGSEKPSLKSQFACPFRKRDSHKYSVQDWPTCALGSFITIARVKAHLYRKHLIYQCQRCKESFETESALETHLQAEDACKLKDAESVDGVTQKMVDQLRSRKKAYPGQTEPERWQQIFEIIFPGVPVPDPYFEPIKDNNEIVTSPSAATNDLEAYENYMREELPRIVRNAIEKDVFNTKVGPLENVLRDKLIAIIREAQDQVFSKYRAMHTSENPEIVATEPQSQHLELISNQQLPYSTEPLHEKNPQLESGPPPWLFDEKINGIESSDWGNHSIQDTWGEYDSFTLRDPLYSVNPDSSISSNNDYPLTYGQTRTSSMATPSREKPQSGREKTNLEATKNMEPPPKPRGPKLAPLQLPEPEPATNRSDTDLTIKALIASQPEVPNDRPRKTAISGQSTAGSDPSTSQARKDSSATSSTPAAP